jgi:hypothetical protein
MAEFETPEQQLARRARLRRPDDPTVPVAPATKPPRRLGILVAITACLGIAVGLTIGALGFSRQTQGPTKAAVTETTTRTTTDLSVQRVTARPTIIKTIATKTKIRTRTVTYQPTYDAYGDGTYVVGTDIEPGIYHTDADGSICYWARLASLDTNDIIDNGNPGGPTTIEIQSSDRAFQVQGDCTFGRV